MSTRVLIVDTDPEVCALLGARLTHDFGCSIVMAASGLEALDLLARRTFGVVLLDLLIAGVDGMEVLRAIRADERLATLPVGVMSTVRDESLVREAVELGVGAYLTKPLNPADLNARLQRFLLRAGVLPVAPPRDWSGLKPGGRVLVLDGNPDFLELVRETLSPRYVVEVSSNGPAGFLTCLDRRPDLVLMGENLGVLPGQVFVDTLRSLPQLARIPVVGIVTSGRTDMTGRVDATITRTSQRDLLRDQIGRAVASHAVGNR